MKKIILFFIFFTGLIPVMKKRSIEFVAINKSYAQYGSEDGDEDEWGDEDEYGGYYDDEGNYYDEYGNFYESDGNGGYYDEYGGYYDDSGGYYDEYGDYTDSDGNYYESDGDGGFYDEYGGYYDEYGGYYDYSGDYTDADGNYYYTDGFGNYYDEYGGYYDYYGEYFEPGNNGGYFGEDGSYYGEDGSYREGAPFNNSFGDWQYEGNGNWVNNEGYTRHDNGDGTYNEYEDETLIYQNVSGVPLEGINDDNNYGGGNDSGGIPEDGWYVDMDDQVVYYDGLPWQEWVDQEEWLNNTSGTIPDYNTALDDFEVPQGYDDWDAYWEDYYASYGNGTLPPNTPPVGCPILKRKTSSTTSTLSVMPGTTDPDWCIQKPAIPPTPYTDYGNVNYYYFRYEDYIMRNAKRTPHVSPPDYYLEYGDKYIKRFTDDTSPTLSTLGKQWFSQVRKNLQIAMDNRLKEDDGADFERDGIGFKSFAFATHVDAYWNAGLYNLETLDLVKIFLTPDIEDLISTDGSTQIQAILSKFGDYYQENPVVLGNRTVEAVNDAYEIYALIADKISQEGSGLSQSQLLQFDDYLAPIKSLFGF